jgi:hypothetical protein
MSLPLTNTGDHSGCAVSNTEFVGSNPSRVMDVSVLVYFVCVALCFDSGLSLADPQFRV